MPSLRRSVSSPMVRSSPYPLALSLSAAASAPGTANPSNRPRRVGSESDAGRRRVLADIEWWRVLDGQQSEEDQSQLVADIDVGTEVEPQTGLGGEQLRAVASPVVGTDAAAVMGLVLHLRPEPEPESDVSAGALSITAPFAALSISPVVLPAPARIYRPPQSQLDSYVSSVESSPASTPLASPYQCALFMPPFDTDCIYARPGPCEAPLPFIGSQPNSLCALSMMRSASFGGFASPRESADDRFGDVIFL
ncbi:hypothetical protein M0805_003089 [Coniferiporia weirii]|nr:hypothetical protein M0805_003089 [Coniferiporia weirii]